MKNIFYFLAILLISAGSAANMDCDCNAPGLALVKVFMDVDGMPNTNIEKISVYPGQDVLFKGLKDFELVFRRDPEDPDGREKKIASRDGKIFLKVSEKYRDVLAELPTNNKNNNLESRSVKEVIIKYDIYSGGRKRDPRIRIIEF